MAKMDAEVKTLLNKTLGSYSDDYRGNVRRIITGTLDECVRQGILPRHTLSGIELAPRIVTAEQYEQQNKGMVSVTDDTVRDARRRPHRHRQGQQAAGSAPASCPAWASPPGCSARWDCGSRKPWSSARPTSGSAPTRPGTCTCAGRPARTAGSWSPSSTARPATSGTSPCPTWCGTWSLELPDGPLCPGPNGTPYMPYSTARNRFGRMLVFLGISGVHTHIAAPPVRQRGPGRRPPRAGEHLPGPRPRQHRDHAAVLHPRQRQRRAAHRQDDECPLDRQAQAEGRPR